MQFTTTGLIAAMNAIDTAADTIGRIPASARRLAHQVATADASAWAGRIERTARIAAVVLAFLFTIGTITAEALYSLGSQFRQALDERNDQLAAIWVRLWVGAPAAPAPMITAPAPAPLLLAPAAVVPIALLAPAAPRPARRSRAAKATTAPQPSTKAPRPARRARRRPVEVAA
jgi:hypothetical protein